MSLLLALTGSSGGYSLSAASGSYVSTGQVAIISRGLLLTAGAGAYTLTGQSASIARSKLLTASAGSYTLSGQAATITYHPLAGYTITASNGSYSVTGRDVTIVWSGAPTPPAIDTYLIEIRSFTERRRF